MNISVLKQTHYQFWSSLPAPEAVMCAAIAYRDRYDEIPTACYVHPETLAAIDGGGPVGLTLHPDETLNRFAYAFPLKGVQND